MGRATLNRAVYVTMTIRVCAFAFRERFVFVTLQSRDIYSCIACHYGIDSRYSS